VTPFGPSQWTGVGRDGLDAVADIAGAAGLWRVADAVYHAADRLREGLFYVTCVGQFKRGKSSLVNALVGAAVLPTGVIPITSAVTIVRHGERLAARVRFHDRGYWNASFGMHSATSALRSRADWNGRDGPMRAGSTPCRRGSKQPTTGYVRPKHSGAGLTRMPDSLSCSG